MAKITMKSPQLVIRPMVLVNDTHSRQHGPVVEYAYLKELWNVQKEALFQEILHSFGTDGKELYCRTISPRFYCVLALFMVKK